jgi:CRISPR-associated endonuclease/helicase Cas3
MNKNFIAHIKKNPDGSWAEPHFLKDHLLDTAKLASKFAKDFGNSDWAELVALLHDLGKYHPDWQKYIRKETGYDEEAHIEGYAGRPNHSTAGAVYIFEKFRNIPIAKALAYVIAGHHSGLPDWNPQLSQRIYDENRNLISNDLEKIKVVEEAKQFFETPIPKTTPPFFKENKVDNEQIHLWIRMLFSCLVDADFLDTEKYMEAKERGGYLSLNELKNKFDNYMNDMKPDSEINKKRNQILNQCREKAKLQPGFFSLTVPTGGGKTLSSMAFALEHAIEHKKKRIIVAIPYTSIIEQTAEIFKSVFGDDQVVEHHSNLDPETENSKNRLASENWDAPIIVTTNVQLFESLFGNRTSACRKLHNIVNSVIILDEAQMIPTHHLKPILSVLKGLVNNFKVTVLLMSATQPALTGKIGSPPNIIDGLENVKEIIDNPDELSKNFKRVNYILPKDLNQSESWDEIAENLQQHNQVLCIVNKRDDCRALHKLMPEGTIHLSGYMCGEERSEVIADIKTKLKNNEPIRVISTQIVEAGVDIDFPVVYRALTGLDSIAQAAGRCNRENKIKEGGKVYVFVPPSSSPQGFLRKCEDAGKAILRNYNESEFTPNLYSEYFKYLYSNLNSFGQADFQNRLIQDAKNFEFQFKEYAEKFNMIDDKKQMSIIVRYKNSQALIDQLKYAGATKDLLRRLQRYIVNIPIYTFNKIREANYIEEINGYWVQCDDNLYKPGLGLIVDESEWTFGDGVV